jgi:integrase
MAELTTDERTGRLKYLNKVTTRGRDYWFFRTQETGNIKLPGDYGSGAFFRAYGEAIELRDRRRAGVSPADPDSFAALVDAYLKSAEYRALADSTQLDYARTCAVIVDGFGDVPYRYTTRAMIRTLRDDFQATPRKANKIVTMLSALYGWAQQGEKVPDGFNPAAGLKKLKRKGGDKEIVPWSDQEVAWVLAAAPLHVQTPVLIALYTGQRREDVVTMTWQQDQGDCCGCGRRRPAR